VAMPQPKGNGREVCASLRLFRSTSAPAFDVLSAPAAVPKAVSVHSSSHAALLSRIEGVKKWDVAIAASRMRASTAPKGLQVRRFEKLLSCVFLSCRPPSRLCFVCCLACVLRVLFRVLQLTFYSLFPHSGRVYK